MKNQKIKTKVLICLGILFLIFFFNIKINTEYPNRYIQRKRVIFKLPFCSPKTYILIDSQLIGKKEKVIFFFDYVYKLAYQLNNGALSVMGLYDVK